MKPQTKLCENCNKRESVVGLGDKWVCMPCFEEGLKPVRKAIESVMRPRA